MYMNDNTDVVDELNMGEVVDMSSDSFKCYCVDKNIGFLKGLRIYLISTFHTLVRMRDDLREALQQSEEGDNKQKLIEALEGIYSKLLRIEEKYLLCEEYIKQREIIN